MLRLEDGDGTRRLRRGGAVRALRRRAARARDRRAQRRRRAAPAAGARRRGDRAARPRGAPGGAPAGRAGARRAAREPDPRRPARPRRSAERAREGLRAGYACFKVKVGLPDDEERVAAVREAVGPWPALRVDANGAWTVDEAVRAIRALEQHDLEFVEQPCAHPRGAAPRCAGACPPRSRRTSRSRDRASVRRARRAGGLRRGQREAGQRGRLRAGARGAAVARANGLGAFLSSTLDGPWGIAAALQLAAAEDLQLACGLATLELFDSPLARALPAPVNGTLKVPGGPGLGVDDRLSPPSSSTSCRPSPSAAPGSHRSVGRAVDVGVGHAGLDRPTSSSNSIGSMPWPAGPTTSAGRIVPVILAGPRAGLRAGRAVAQVRCTGTR